MQSAEEPSKKQVNKTDLKGLLQVVGMCPRCCHWVFCFFFFLCFGFFLCFLFFVSVSHMVNVHIL